MTHLSGCMPLTAFGLKCRQHRTRLGLIMADQSKALGVATSLISSVERGEADFPVGYARELANWMQLDQLETVQLISLSRLRPKGPKKLGLATIETDLKEILDRLAVEETV